MAALLGLWKEKRACVVGLLALWLTIDALAAPVTIEPPSSYELYEDEIFLDCDEITEYREAFGVTDTHGETHPGFNGWTRPIFDINWETGPVTLTSPGYRCPCNGQVYNAFNSCLAGCKVSLACFTGICEPIVPVRASAKPINVKAFAEIAVSVFKWQPTDSLACFVAGINWEHQVLQHEHEHVMDILELLRKMNEKWASATAVEVTDATALGAINLLEERLNQIFEQERQSLEDDSDAIAAAFHDSPAGGVIADPNCGCAASGF
jgi:hypothetical protein